jgi:hypothetical protein
MMTIRRKILMKRRTFKKNIEESKEVKKDKNRKGKRKGRKGKE